MDDGTQFRTATLYDVKRLLIFFQFTLAGIALPVIANSNVVVAAVSMLAVVVGVVGSLHTLS